MIYNKEDNEPASGINIFLILFMLLSFVSLNNPERHNSLSGSHDFQPDLVFGRGTGNTYATICRAYYIPDFQAGVRESAINKILNNFSFHDLLSEYGRRLDQNNIVIQRKQLIIKPCLRWKIRIHQFTEEDPVLPVLS
jgi:hypothetical protein